MYQPILGRFLSRDPLPVDSEATLLYDPHQILDQGRLLMQLYAYASNNPINRIDPSGLIDILPCRKPGKTHVECQVVTVSKDPGSTCPSGYELVRDQVPTVDRRGTLGVVEEERCIKCTGKPVNAREKCPSETCAVCADTVNVRVRVGRRIRIVAVKRHRCTCVEC